MKDNLNNHNQGYYNEQLAWTIWQTQKKSKTR